MTAGLTIKPWKDPKYCFRANAGRPHREGFKRGVEAALAVANARKLICEDAVAKVKAGELYPDTPTAFATENCARLEAAEICRQIEALLAEIS